LLRARPTAISLLVLAVGVATYTGFRMPNDWTATLDAVSITDGFYRRIVVGTLLHPLAVVTHDNYWIFAAESYLVSAALLTITVITYLRTKLTSQRLLIIGWLLLPTGGYFFNEVGYYDQVLYLLLFASVWLLYRDRTIFASILMTVSTLVHEIAILTVLPIFAMVALRRLSFRRTIAVLTPPVVLTGILLVIVAPASPGATSRLAFTLARANFPYRADALGLFDRTQAQSWQLYHVSDVLIYLVPFLIITVIAFIALRLSGNALAISTTRSVAVRHALVAAIAVGAPIILAFAGWDKERWGLLAVTNFIVVLFLHLRDAGRELTLPQIVVLVAAMFLITHIPMNYFDGYAPRPLQWPAIRQFLSDVVHARIFAIPTT
jgi:hypothetical protein